MNIRAGMKSLDYDILIIGSGAGGGTVAKELAPLCRQGCRIALLEWGGNFETHDNLREELTMAERYYFDHCGFLTDSQDMTLAFAKAVGGSTTVYTGTSLKMPDSVITKWAIPSITPEDLLPRYEKYQKENSIHLVPPGEINENNQLFVEGCRALGWRVEQFPVNTNGCVGLGTCNLGCRAGAKQGTHRVQIPKAVQQGVEVFPFCRVDSLARGAVWVEVLSPQYGLAASPLPSGRHQFKARKIVLAAGAVHSPALLLRSFGKRRWPALGGYFTCHPALILAAEHARPIENIAGHPKSFFCDEFAAKDRFLLETCIYYPFTLSKSIAAFGVELDSFLSRMDRLQMILTLAIDDPIASNRVHLDRKGNPRVTYRFTRKVIESLTASIRASQKIFFASGAIRATAPASGQFFMSHKERADIDTKIRADRFKLGQVSISAAHLMGGCRMGTDPRLSVTDAWGRLHGEQDLYVADASLFPAASEVNPYLTIMALADRVAEGIKRDLGVNP